jgi:hypothetical protein
LNFDGTLNRNILSAWIGDEQRRCAESALHQAMAHLGGVAGGVFRIGPPRPPLVVARSLDQTGIDRSHEAWATQRRALESGLPVSGDRWIVAPIPGDDGQVCGLIYIEAEGPLPEHTRQAVAAVGPLLALTLQGEAARVDADSAAVVMSRLSEHEVEREHLLAVCRKEQWNIARVARTMGITRVTVYSRLRRFGLVREKIQRGRPRTT